MILLMMGNKKAPFMIINGAFDLGFKLVSKTQLLPEI